MLQTSESVRSGRRPAVDPTVNSQLIKKKFACHYFFFLRNSDFRNRQAASLPNISLAWIFCLAKYRKRISFFMIPMIHTGLGPFFFLPLVLLLHKSLLEQEIKSCKLVLPRRKPDLPKIAENLRDLTPRWPRIHPEVVHGGAGRGKWGGPNYHCRHLSAPAPPFFPSWPARGNAGQRKPEESPRGFLKQFFWQTIRSHFRFVPPFPPTKSSAPPADPHTRDIQAPKLRPKPGVEMFNPDLQHCNRSKFDTKQLIREYIYIHTFIIIRGILRRCQVRCHRSSFPRSGSSTK